MSQLVQTPLWAHQQETIARFSEVRFTLNAWEMGTGKTLFAIEMDLQLRDRLGVKRTLVVAPMATHKGWLAAYQHEAPHLRVKRINPKKRSEFFDPKAHVHIIHYEVLAKMPELAKIFHHGIFDECHRLNNREAKQTIAAKALKIPLLTDMSGSPVDKSEQLWSILNHLYPKEYRSYWKFFHAMTVNERPWVKGKNGKPVQASYYISKGPSDLWLTTGLKRIEPFFDRRLTEDCIDLPEVQNIPIEVELTPKMRKTYTEMEEEMLTWVDIEGNEEEEEALASPVIIAQRQRLQQMALATIKFNVERDKFTMHMPSPKIEALLQIIEDNNSEAFVVFSQFKAPLELLHNELMKPRRKIESVLYTGDVPAEQRDINLQKFFDSQARVFMATIGAGGEGIDGMQYVSRNVVFLDKSWMPEKNNQALRRVLRAGQKHPVNIIDLTAINTIDQHKALRLRIKQLHIKQTLGDI